MEKINYSICSKYDEIISLHKLIFNEDNKTFLDNLKTKNYYKVYQASHCGVAIAYCIISNISGEAEIINIGVLQEWRNCKIATRLLQFAILNEDFDTMYLEVSTANIAAIKLYKACGFIEYAIRKKYYGDYDAIVMKLHKNL